MQRTIRLKLNTTQLQGENLKQTLSEFTQAFNFVCEYGWSSSEKNGVKLHPATYYTLKELCKGLVSDLIVQARLKATEAVKSAFASKKTASYLSTPFQPLPGSLQSAYLQTQLAKLHRQPCHQPR